MPTKLYSLVPDTMSEVHEATEFSLMGNFFPSNVLIDCFLLDNKSEHLDGFLVKMVL